jgi:hypothetical protein
MSSILDVDANVFLITETAKPQLKQQKRLFVICDDCFWVASALGTRYSNPVACPLCGRPLSSLRISNDEGYAMTTAKTAALS